MGDYTFKGWAGYGPDSVQGNMKYIDFDPPAFDDDYVDGEWDWNRTLCKEASSHAHTQSRSSTRVSAPRTLRSSQATLVHTLALLCAVTRSSARWSKSVPRLRGSRSATLWASEPSVTAAASASGARLVSCNFTTPHTVLGELTHRQGQLLPQLPLHLRRGQVQPRPERG